MENLIQNFVYVFFIAILVEAITQNIFKIKVLKEFDKKIKWFPMTIFTSLALSIGLCFKVNVDILSIIFTNVNNSPFGYILTGILASRGSNKLHDILNKIKTVNVIDNK